MQLGIDSMTVATFVGELQQRSGLELSPTLIYEYSTAEGVAQYLVQRLRGDDMHTPFVTPLAESSSAVSIAIDLAGMAGRWPSSAHSSVALWRLAKSFRQ